MDLIDRNQLDEVCSRLNENGWGITRNEYKLIDRVLFEFPSAEKTGKWIYDDEAYPGGNPYGHYDCDQCGESVPHKTNYCQNCGARMENENE